MNRSPAAVEIWKRRLRAAAAYVIACLAASGVWIAISILPPWEIVFSGQREFLQVWLGIAVYAFGFAALPTMLAVTLFKKTAFPRGLGDVIGGALVGLCAPTLASVLLGYPFLVWTQDNALAWHAPIIVAGAAGGLCYWLSLGMPKR